MRKKIQDALGHKTLVVGLVILLVASGNVFAQSDSLIFRDDFNRSTLGINWQHHPSWSIVNGLAYNSIDGSGGILRTSIAYLQPSYIIETVAKGFTVNYYREFRITFGQQSLTDDSMYVLSYTPYSGGQLTLSKSTDNVYYPSRLDEAILFPDLSSSTSYTFKIARYKSGLIQVYLDKGTGYSTIPLLEAIDTAYVGLGHFGWQVDTQTAAEPFYVDWIEARKPGVEKPAVREKPVEDDLISQVFAETGRAYRVGKLSVGSTHYTDRNYTITSVPDYLNGASFVKTANDDKLNTSASLLTMFVKKRAIVYVGYDPRGTVLPAWLQGWTKTSDKIGTTDPGSSFLNLYSKVLEAGEIYPNPLILGGALASPAAGSNMNYLIAAIESPVGQKYEAENAFTSGASTANNHMGYSGTGFVDYINASNDYIEWTIQIEVDGTYNLGFRYANGATTRALGISLNRTAIGEHSFLPTPDWASWSFYSGVNLFMARGTHKLRATSVGANGPNIDYLSVSYTSASTERAAARISQTVEAETALTAQNQELSPRAFPNPFKTSITISYSLQEKMPVKLSVHTLQGQRTDVLVDEVQDAGAHHVEFDAAHLQHGLYVYRLNTGAKVAIGKIFKE
jgi:hypothetical protein